MPPYEGHSAGPMYRDPTKAAQSPNRPSDPSRLAPHDAYYSSSPPQRSHVTTVSSTGPALRGMIEPRRRSHRERSRIRKKAQWKKLLWVEQQYPDNYTDEETFLHDLKRNPSFQQYEFWPLMADATVIIQHLCSVAIFICCFVGIIQERVSPVMVVGCGTLGTVFAWGFWDFWVGQEEVAEATLNSTESSPVDGSMSTSASSGTLDTTVKETRLSPMNTHSSGVLDKSSKGHAHSTSATSVGSNSSFTSPPTTGHPTGAPSFAAFSSFPTYGEPASMLSPRMQQRVATAKSAILIFFAVLGLSPILKSLTKSTTSDSIWAMSCWLMCINVFFFDYSSTVGAKFSASLSTNAALMASTVLASRLPSTTQVFSLTLFSIEVFGLFPVFRRHLRHISWIGHLSMTIFLVVGASGGVGATISGGGWKAAFGGVILGGITTFLAMGICSWWLIGLQKYKNEIHGPWDPARPVIRRRWD